MMHADWFRWAVGGLMAVMGLFFIQLVAALDTRNETQDTAIMGIQKRAELSDSQQLTTFRTLSSANANTARILEGVARQLEAIDERGSRALLSHTERGH
jgi:hypothetical protein